ncbi:MAG: hypothetical protein RLY20_3398 [Verrucomicrobiota bacterium]|jgi:hypothetical protein
MLDLFLDLTYVSFLIANPWMIPVAGFMVWMFVNAVRRKEWLWAAFIVLGFGFSAVFYFFAVYRSRPSATSGYELPGSLDKTRVKELEIQIQNIDNAHHHSQLGDVYFQQGKLAKAEACYRAALQRDPQDLDTRAHLGQCLLRLKRMAEAKPLLEGVVVQDAQHDYGHTKMALAETFAALGEPERALQLWKEVTENHAYPRARVQYAEMLIARNEIEPARAVLTEVIDDDPHAPTHQRQRDRVWTRKARSLLKKIG